jgi:hypothetical protein
MFQAKYRITVRIGDHEFYKDFDYENPALTCFDSIASTKDEEVVGDTLTQPSEAKVESVTIRRYEVPVRIGDPTRR